MISILNYGMGNIKSVQNALDYQNIQNRIINTPLEVEKSTKLILPGVGSFHKAMEVLTKKNLIESLSEIVLVKKKPILGICLGMQLFADWSEEGDVKGLGWINGSVEKFKDVGNIKIPHIGFNNVRVVSNSSPIFREINQSSDFYFVHSYHFNTLEKNDIVAETIHGNKFTSSVAKGNIFGVQFHPEKSQINGLKILKNFHLYNG